MFCDKCGNLLDDGSVICSNCGCEIKGQENHNGTGAEGASREGMPVTGAEGASREGMPATGAEGVSRESMPATGAEGVSREGMPATGAEGVSRESMPVTGAEGVSRESMPATGAEGLSQENTTAGINETIYTVSGQGNTSGLKNNKSMIEESFMPTPEALNYVYEDKGASYKKANTKKWTMGIAGVALLGVLLVVVLNFNVIANVIQRTILPAEKYYQNVEKKEMKKLANMAGPIFDKLQTQALTMNNQSMETTMELELGEMIYELLGSTFEMDNPEIFSRITIDSQVINKDKKFYGEMALALSDKPIISAQGYSDLEGKQIFGKVPELSDKYMGKVVAEADEELYASMFQVDVESEKLIPGGELAKQLIDRYASIYIENAVNVTKENTELTVGEITRECILLKASFTQKEVFDIAEQYLTSMKEDEELKMLAVEWIAYYNPKEQEPAQYWIDMLDEGIRNAVNQKAAGSDDVFIEMCIWVDDKGKVIGRSIENKMEGMGLSCQTTKAKGDTNILISYNDSVDTFEFVGTVEEDDDMQWVGDFELNSRNAAGEERNLLYVTLDHFSIENILKGSIDTKIHIRPRKSLFDDLELGTAAYFLDNYSLVYELKTDENEEYVSMSIVDGDEMMIRWTVNAKIGEEKDIVLPADVIWLEDEEDLNEWLETVSFKTVLDNLRNAGLPKEWVDVLEEETDYLVNSPKYY